MGYSISIHVSSDELRGKILQFLEKNYRCWPAVCGKGKHSYSRGPTDDISYGGTKTSIGFDYGAMSGFERDYIYSVLRWMAIKVGDRKTEMFTDETEEGPSELVIFLEPIPYYKYDCDSFFTPILVVTEEQELTLPESHRHWAVDEWGVRIGPIYVRSQIGSALGLLRPDSNFRADMDSLGTIPNEDGEARESWIAKQEGVFLKYLKPEIEENIGFIRQEIQRLDQLWTGGV
jgi:hypothetical protein